MNLNLYEANRDLMKTGDKIEFASNSLVGKSIRWKTGQKVNHTATIICLPNYKEVKEPHVYIMEANPSGTELNYLSAVLSKYDGKAYWNRIKCKDYRREIISDWHLTHVGIPYDYKSLFRNLAGRVNEDMNRLFCSEAHFFGMQAAGLIFPSDKLVPVPGTFEKLYPNLYGDEVAL